MASNGMFGTVIGTIQNWCKKLSSTLHKDVIEESLDVAYSQLNGYVAPVYKSYANVVKGNKKLLKFTSKTSQEINKVFYRNMKGKLMVPGANNFIIEIDARMSNFISVIDNIRTIVQDKLESNTIVESASLQKLVAIKAASESTYVANYLLTLLDYVVSCEMYESTKNEDWLPSPASTNIIVAGVPKTAMVLSAYAIPIEQFNKNFYTVPDIYINENNADAIGKLNPSKGLLDLDTGFSLASGFIGNPIYHIRMAYTEYQTKNYRLNQERKKSLELKLMWLEEQAKEKFDPEVEKEIIYLRESIEKLDYDIAEMEERT